MINLESVSKRFGNTEVLTDITLFIDDSSTTVVIGPSGCGKSTLVRLINGLLKADSGKVIINGTGINSDNVYTMRHQIGYVIQEGGLFPHMTARKNISVLADFLRLDPVRISERIAYLCDLTKFPIDSLGRYPVQLSRGQRQRVSLMRALILDPQILLLDEPLGSLDPVTRADLQKDLKSIFKKLRKTVLLVTHDLGEAQYFRGTLVLMKDGRIVQRGSFEQLVNSPSSPFVTEFINAQRLIVYTAPG